jgi:SPP1 family predicted phage head-tail adaptor
MAFDPLHIEAGTLRHSITIQAQSTVRDAAGQLNSTWSPVLTTRAQIEGTSSLTFKFAFENNALAANTTECITIRYPAVDVTPGMQVIWGDQTYTIQAVDDVLHRHRVLHLACVGISTGSQ